MDHHDMMQEGILWPWIDDPGPDPTDESNYDPCGDDPGDMDGDHETGLSSAGFGTDEDYGCFDSGDNDG